MNSILSNSPNDTFGSDEDLMLALALQQEASSSLAPSACVVSGERPGANDPSDVAWGDEAVALALYNEERARFEQQRREPEALSPPLPAEHADRRPLLHWDRCAETSSDPRLFAYEDCTSTQRTLYSTCG